MGRVRPARKTISGKFVPCRARVSTGPSRERAARTGRATLARRQGFAGTICRRPEAARIPSGADRSGQAAHSAGSPAWRFRPFGMPRGYRAGAIRPAPLAARLPEMPSLRLWRPPSAIRRRERPAEPRMEAPAGFQDHDRLLPQPAPSKWQPATPRRMRVNRPPKYPARPWKPMRK